MARKTAVPTSILQLLEKRETPERRAQVRRAKADRRAAGKVKGIASSGRSGTGPVLEERRSGAERRQPVQRRRKLRRKSG